MSAPIQFINFDTLSGDLWVVVGKSDSLRKVEMTDRDRAVLLIHLAQWAASRAQNGGAS